ncbi:MAG TPA: transcriptional repressor, partial [Magnetospirillaceae bacterium]|nr:transcriptional repressor [Magnetospirillaceae bacterium]
GFKHQVELSEIFTPHHHHARCQNCGQTTDIASPELESALSKLAKEHDFLALNHSVELLGYCQKCQ